MTSSSERRERARDGLVEVLTWLLPWRARRTIQRLRRTHWRHIHEHTQYNARTVRPIGWCWCNWCHLWVTEPLAARGDMCSSCAAMLREASKAGVLDELKAAPPNVFRPTRMRNHAIQINGRWISPLLSPERSNRQGNSPDVGHQRQTGADAEGLPMIGGGCP